MAIGRVKRTRRVGPILPGLAAGSGPSNKAGHRMTPRDAWADLARRFRKESEWYPDLRHAVVKLPTSTARSTRWDQPNPVISSCDAFFCSALAWRWVASAPGPAPGHEQVFYGDTGYSRAPSRRRLADLARIGVELASESGVISPTPPPDPNWTDVDWAGTWMNLVYRLARQRPGPLFRVREASHWRGRPLPGGMSVAELPLGIFEVSAFAAGLLAESAGAGGSEPEFAPDPTPTTSAPPRPTTPTRPATEGEQGPEASTDRTEVGSDEESISDCEESQPSIRQLETLRRSDPLPDPSELTVGGLARIVWEIERLHRAAGSSCEAWDGKYTWDNVDRLTRRALVMVNAPGFSEFKTYLNAELGMPVIPEALTEVERRLARRLRKSFDDVRRLSLLDALKVLQPEAQVEQKSKTSPDPTPATSAPAQPTTSAPLETSHTTSKAQPLPPPADPIRDEATLAKALRKAKKPKQARLVEFMIGKDAAEFETLAEAVHGNAETSDDAVEKNARTTSDSAATLGYRVRYEPRSGWVYKEIAAE
jgi:hypothetical protein